MLNKQFCSKITFVEEVNKDVSVISEDELGSLLKNSGNNREVLDMCGPPTRSNILTEVTVGNNLEGLQSSWQNGA